MSRPSRFPLVKALLRAAEDARLSESQIESRISRRSFLKSTALVTGITAIDVVMPGISWSQRRSKPSIAIVGGGLAGLTAAYELRKKGMIATIYEANTRMGGRVMTTREQFGPGLYTEFGAEFIDTGHKEIFRLAQELNLSMIDVRPDTRSHLKELFYFGGKRRTEEELVTAFKPASTQLFSDAFEVKTKGPRFGQLDKTTLDAYVDGLQVEKWMKDLLEVAFIIEYGLDSGEQSACNMLSMIDADISDNDVELYGDSDERYRINGGNDQIIRGLTRKIEDQIQHGYWLTSIYKRGSRYGLRFLKDRSMHDIIADIVIIAIPFTTLRNVEINAKFDDAKLKTIRELGYGSNSKIIFSSKKHGGVTVWETEGSNGGLFTDLSIQSGWDSAPRQSDFASSYTVYLGGSKAAHASRVIEQSLNDLETIMPGFSQSYSGIAKSFIWQDYKYSLGSYTCYKPGQWAMQGIEGKSVKNLFFAGEHCSADHQGFMEGAAETGVKAANAIVAKVKR